VKRARGFTLIELMISLALAGLIVGGALQLHASFNRQAQRQSEIAELQQTLRVSMLILERAIRQAGQGIPGGKFDEERGTPPSCSGAKMPHYAFQWSNKNAYADPINPTTSAVTDTDPDWFVTLFVPDSAPVYADNDQGSNLRIVNPPSGIPDLSTWNDGDLMAIVLPSGICVREISKGSAHGGSGGTKYVQHNPAQSNRCYNYVPSKDPCLELTPPKWPVPVRHLSSGQTVYRVMPIGDPMNPTATPKLAMRAAPMGTAYSAVPWTIIAENIEDMQLAVILSDGRICTSVDDPNPGQCELSLAAAVRVTLVARSTVEQAGYRDGMPVATQREDEPPTPTTTPKDGYLRRSLTAQIELRNMGANP
jgi:prepilin-type N-terminal cleavage/methylation domain-containing protein